MTVTTNPRVGKRVLRTVLYVLAGIVLVVGILIALSLFNAPSAFITLRMAFNTPLVTQVLDQVNRLFALAGAAVLVVSLLLSGILVACGRLISQNMRLAEQVSQLEARLAAPQSPPEIDPSHGG